MVRGIAKSSGSVMLVIACLFAAFTFAVTNLKQVPIGNDEFNSLSHVQSFAFDKFFNLAQTVQSVSERSQQHGPLYFVLLNIWQSLAGTDLFSARLFSTLFGLLAIAIAYRVALLTVSRESGLATVFILGFLAFFLYYMHIARMYTLLAAIVGWLVWAYWKTIRWSGAVPRWQWLMLFVPAALLLYTHYFGIMILASIGLYHLVFARKGRRWRQVSLVIIIAGLSFAPWLPVAISGFTGRISLDDSRLPLLESLLTVMRIYSNGHPAIPLLALALAAIYHRRLTPAEKYLLFISVATLLLAGLVNEVTPILVERRIRYMTVLAVPFCACLAIGLRLMPGWRLLRLPLLALWIASAIAFTDSEDLWIYTNKRAQNLGQVPHYQEFIYQSERLPGQNELILSIHPNTRITVRKILDYYRKALPRWSHVAHISVNEDGEADIQSGLSTYATLEAIAANSNGIWLIYNPQQTGLSAMPLYTDWLTEHFAPCRRYLDKADRVIEYYVAREFPCELITADKPFAVHYVDGTELANFEYERSPESLSFFFWWGRTIGADYSVSLQIFDEEGNKALWLDAVISLEPLDQFTFDISELAAGEYVVKLIVYDFVSKASQSGVLVAEQLAFDRDIELLRFSVD